VKKEKKEAGGHCTARREKTCSAELVVRNERRRKRGTPEEPRLKKKIPQQGSSLEGRTWGESKFPLEEKSRNRLTREGFDGGRCEGGQ